MMERFECCECEVQCTAANDCGEQRRDRHTTNLIFHDVDERHTVNLIFDPDDNRIVFMYTVGLHPDASELFALNVRKEDADEVGLLMNSLATRVVMADQTAKSENGTVYNVRAVRASRKRELKRTHLTQMAPAASILELVPRAI